MPAQAPELANLWFEDVRMSWQEPITPDWLRRLTESASDGGAGTPAAGSGQKLHFEVPLKIATHASIEIFLSPFGIGVLSIPLMVESMLVGLAGQPRAPAVALGPGSYADAQLSAEPTAEAKATANPISTGIGRYSEQEASRGTGEQDRLSAAIGIEDGNSRPKLRPART